MKRLKEQLRRAAAVIAARRGELVLDGLGIAGLGAVAKGAHDVYPPAAWLVVGTGLLAYVVVVSVKGARR